MIKISQKLKDKLWWLIISVDYDYSRITIADHNLTDDNLTLWLEDKQDFKNTLDECLQLDVPAKQFARLIKDEGLNSYEGSKVHPVKNYVYKSRIEINAPMTHVTGCLQARLKTVPVASPWYSDLRSASSRGRITQR